ncbi:DUF2867 domain-containing protein [Arthrobacter sp. BE255]|uniref:DUF2867 domain-containing protein n=1 Tax=Arthrobacter sp. BE255 TaxID=2817721 RepID=UPI00286CB473|nr:DUF2867 domain-containing protein [Arthrobacter sp. BE255]
MDPDPENEPSGTVGGADAGNLPVFRSLALESIPVPDYADVIVLPVPRGASAEPRVWAEELFSLESMPGWVAALMGLRQAVVGLMGISRAPAGVFAVAAVSGEEALISADDTHMDFRCGVAYDAGARLLRVTTAVRLKGWRGRLYFAPVRLLHPLVVHAMMARTIRRLTLLP